MNRTTVVNALLALAFIMAFFVAIFGGGCGPNLNQQASCVFKRCAARCAVGCVQCVRDEIERCKNGQTQ